MPWPCFLVLFTAWIFNYFKALLIDPEDVILPLLGFNVGIELGNFDSSLYYGGILCFLSVLKIKSREWNLFVSGGLPQVWLCSPY